MVGIRSFSFGMAYFQGWTVSFRKCSDCHIFWSVSKYEHHIYEIWCITMYQAASSVEVYRMPDLSESFLNDAGLVFAAQKVSGIMGLGAPKGKRLKPPTRFTADNDKSSDHELQTPTGYGFLQLSLHLTSQCPTACLFWILWATWINAESWSKWVCLNINEPLRVRGGGYQFC